MQELIKLTENLPAVEKSTLPVPALQQIQQHYTQHTEQDFSYIFFMDHPVHHKPWFIPFTEVDLIYKSNNREGFPTIGGRFWSQLLRPEYNLNVLALDETLGTGVPDSVKFMQDWQGYLCDSFNSVPLTTNNYKLNAVAVINFGLERLEIGIVGLFPLDYSFELSHHSFTRMQVKFNIDLFETKYHAQSLRIADSKNLNYDGIINNSNSESA